MTESRRKELIALGFPDDGYDYLHHLKQLGPKTRRPSSRRKVSAQQRGSRHAVPMAHACGCEGVSLCHAVAHSCFSRHTLT